MISRPLISVLVLALALRLAIFFLFPSIPQTLANRVEISTPVTGYKRLQEGLFLYKHGVSPYDGGVFHQVGCPISGPLAYQLTCAFQAPLLLAFFSTFPSQIFINLVYTLADISSALSIAAIASSGIAASSPLYTSPRKSLQWPPWRVAAAFLFNPFTLATCASRSTIVFTNTFVLLAVSKAVGRKPIAAMLALAMATYLSLYPILILVPLILLCYDNIPNSPRKPSIYKYAAIDSTLFASAMFGLLALSYAIAGKSWEFLGSTYGVHLLLPDLTPNAGLWWYFFVEMFDSFRNFFLGVFQLHVLIYVGGLSVRIRRQPLFVITTLLGISSIFKSYPSIGDTALYLSFLSLHAHIFPLMRYTFFATSTLLYASLLGPAFYYLWIYAGSGNANFFYAITLVWSLGVTILVHDSLFAVLRDEMEDERPDLKGKGVVQI